MSAAVMNLSAMPFSGRNLLLYFISEASLYSRIFSNREIRQPDCRGFSFPAFLFLSDQSDKSDKAPEIIRSRVKLQ